MNNTDTKKQQAQELLNLHWGYSDFRQGQERVIDNVLSEKNTVVIMPTGGGKSICFQLPALVLEGVTIVISPLISLMKDQVDSLQRIGIPATFINSSISLDETRKRIEGVKKSQYKLLYIAPERFYSNEFMEALKEVDVSLFAIDEAHCISQWGHDFRPSYTRLKYAIQKLGSPTVLALTATATPEVKEDIIKQLDLVDPEVVVTGFARPNLQFGVIQAKEFAKPRIVVDTISSFSEGVGIIYVSTRSRVDELTQILLENDIEAAGYHAGMDPNDRKWVQSNFIENKVRVIVATNAFGLGINKPDVRFVIHYDMPGTVEAYYQEAGRAGRDGKPSLCLMLYNSRDRHLHEFFIKGDNPPPEIIKEIYNILLSYESDTIMLTYSELSEMLLGSVPEMAIGTSIKILEKEGYLKRNKEKTGSAFIKAIEDPKKIREQFSPRAKKQIEVFEKMFDKYGDDLLGGFDFHAEEVAEVLDIKKESLMRLIRKLAKENMFEYQPPFRGTELSILKREEGKELDIDTESLKQKHKEAYEKLDRIEAYIYDWECRQKFILDYFGDEQADKCGKCDVCLGATTITKSVSTGNQKFRSKKKFSDKNKEEGFTVKENKSDLGTKLTQLETLDLYQKGLSLEEIAQKREVKISTIVEHICYLLKMKVLKKEEVDKLVEPGIRKRIIKSIEKNGSEKLKPIYEDLDGKVTYDDIKLVMAGM